MSRADRKSSPSLSTEALLWWIAFQAAKARLLAEFDGGNHLGDAPLGVAHQAAELTDRDFTADVAELRSRYAL
jgi:hypothetical protein